MVNASLPQFPAINWSQNCFQTSDIVLFNGQCLYSYLCIHTPNAFQLPPVIYTFKHSNTKYTEESNYLYNKYSSLQMPKLFLFFYMDYFMSTKLRRSVTFFLLKRSSEVPIGGNSCVTWLNDDTILFDVLVTST